MTERRLTEERICARIAEITKQRDEYKAQVERQANMQIAAFDGAIQALQALLEPEEEGDGGDPPATPAAGG